MFQISNRKMVNPIFTHKILLKDINLSLFSKYRTTLMGIAILGVLTGHFFSMSDVPQSNIVLRLIGNIYILVFTQGFFFLSGLGLYFSFANNHNIREFYSRRVHRLYYPYLLITLPYFIFQDFFYNFDVWKFVGHVSTLGYWFEGNYNGLWYVAVSVILYILYPFVHLFVFSHEKLIAVTIKMILLLGIISIVHLLVVNYFSEFYQNHNLFFEQYSIFFVGMYTGYLITKNHSKYFLLIASWGVISFHIQRFVPDLNFLYEPMKKVVFYMPLICMFFLLFSKIKLVNLLKCSLDWLGTYSLELYIFQSIIYCFLMRQGFCRVDSTFSISAAIVLALVLCKPAHKVIRMIDNHK